MGPAAAWRQDVLLPIYPSDEQTPGYQLTEQIKNDALVPSGWDYHRIYNEDYGLVPPPETMPCTLANVVNVWSQGTFGLVVCWAHGNEFAIQEIMDVDHVQYLNDAYPAFTFQATCSNSAPGQPGQPFLHIAQARCHCPGQRNRVDVVLDWRNASSQDHQATPAWLTSTPAVSSAVNRLASPCTP